MLKTSLLRIIRRKRRTSEMKCLRGAMGYDINLRGSGSDEKAVELDGAGIQRFRTTLISRRSMQTSIWVVVRDVSPPRFFGETGFQIIINTPRQQRQLARCWPEDSSWTPKNLPTNSWLKLQLP
jgi:hypothetical protein